MGLHSLDQVVQQELPTMMVPRFGSFEPLAQQGQRLLMAKDGMWLEVRLSWLYARLPYRLLGSHLPPLPYGTLTRAIEWTASVIPVGCFNRFIETCRANPGIEQAALVLFDSARMDWRYVEPEIIYGNSVAIQYRYPPMSDTESVALDMHSHARAAAGFSDTDDHDDQSAYKLSLVVGHCHEKQVSVAARLCLRGLFVDMSALARQSLMEVQHV